MKTIDRRDSNDTKKIIMEIKDQSQNSAPSRQRARALQIPVLRRSHPRRFHGTTRSFVRYQYRERCALCSGSRNRSFLRQRVNQKPRKKRKKSKKENSVPIGKKKIVCERWKLRMQKSDAKFQLVYPSTECRILIRRIECCVIALQDYQTQRLLELRR